MLVLIGKEVVGLRSPTKGLAVTFMVFQHLHNSPLAPQRDPVEGLSSHDGFSWFL